MRDQLLEVVPEEEPEHEFAGIVQQGSDPVIVELQLRLQPQQLAPVKAVGDDGAGHGMLPEAPQVEEAVLGLDEGVHQLDLLGDRAHLTTTQTENGVVHGPAALVAGAGEQG